MHIINRSWDLVNLLHYFALCVSVSQASPCSASPAHSRTHETKGRRTESGSLPAVDRRIRLRGH